MFRQRQLNGRDLGYADGEFSLTFDDGPMVDSTVHVAKMLAAEKISATFFVLGERARRHELQMVAKLGHQIGNHTYSHPSFDNCGDRLEEIVPQQIDQCHAVIEKFAGASIPFRAPFGHWTGASCHDSANRLPIARRYEGPYHWDINADDWRLNRHHGSQHKITFHEFRASFAKQIRVRRSGIILLHDGFPIRESQHVDLKEMKVAEVVEIVLTEIARQGFRIVNLKMPANHCAGPLQHQGIGK